MGDNITIPADGLAGCKLTLPVDLLAEGIQATIKAYADGYQCNRDFITAAVFAAASTAVGRKVSTWDKRHENFLPLWLCLVAPSGSNKSAPVRAVLRPLTNRNAANYDRYIEEMKQYEAALSSGAKNVEKPVFRQLVISDTTPEARNEALFDNGSILCVSDEIATMLGNLNRYNRSGEASQLLSVWNGDDIIVNRKSTGHLLIKKPALGIIGGVQPDILAATFGSDMFMTNGMNQRWLFVYPDNEPPAMYCETYVAQYIAEAWAEYVCALIDRTFPYEQLLIDFDAKKIYIDYYNRLQDKKAEAEPYMAAVYSKLQIIVQRWAGIAHILGTVPETRYIAPEEMEYAARCMDYFEQCAEKVYLKLLGGNKQASTEHLTKEQIIAMCYNSFSPQSKQAFADAIGVSRPLVSRAVSKYPMLRSYGYGDMLDTDNEKDNKETGVTS